MDNCKDCLNSRLIVSENGFHYNCIFSSRKAIKCMTNGYCYYSKIKIDENNSIHIVDKKGMELKW